MNNNEVPQSTNEDEKQPLQDMDLSNMILIKNPNNELAIEEKIQSDVYNSIASIKQVTHHHYGTIPNHFSHHAHNLNRTFLSSTRQDYYNLKLHYMAIKSLVVIISLLLIILDTKNIKYRIDQQEEIIAELRTIHIQMDDLQLYQIFWSFLIVYIGSLICYCLCIIVMLVNDSHLMIKYTFRLLMFTLLYQFIEIILRRYDFLLIFLRIILILLMKIWINISVNLTYILIFHPDYANGNGNPPDNMQ